MNDKLTDWAFRNALYDLAESNEEFVGRDRLLKYLKEDRTCEEVFDFLLQTDPDQKPLTLSEVAKLKDEYFSPVAEMDEIYITNDFENKRNDYFLTEEEKKKASASDTLWRYGVPAAATATAVGYAADAPLVRPVANTAVKVPWKVGKFSVTTIWKLIKMFGDPNFWKKSGKTLLVVGGLTAVGVAAYKVYDRYYSRIGQLCSGRTRDERTICILQHKIRGCEEAIQKYREALLGCQYKDNPDKCQFKIQQQISKWSLRARKYQKKLGHLVH